MSSRYVRRLEEPVHLVDHDRTFADRGRDALDRAGADVPDREDTGSRRLEHVLLDAGDHEPVAVPGDLVR